MQTCWRRKRKAERVGLQDGGRVVVTAAAAAAGERASSGGEAKEGEGGCVEG